MKAKARVLLLLLATIAAYFVISISYRYLHEQFVVDSCLSGKHGSFDYLKMSCDLDTNRPYISYHARHPHDKRNLQIAFVSFVACLSSFWYVKKQLR